METLEFLKTHRRALHQIPELGMDCERTACYIEKQLHDFGYQTKRYAQTAVVAFKEGRTKKAIAFRSDMDALPVTEHTSHDFASKESGKMHACGHDAHMSILLRLADELKDTSLNKSILFLFQPGEEGPGGARFVVEEGLFKDYDVEAIFGLHVNPNLEMGKIGLVDGPIMASSDELVIDIVGKAAHAAAPHDGIDAILASAHLIQAYQSIISRNMNPLDKVVLTIGTIMGGEAQNVIAQHVQLKGTIRAYTEDVFEIAERRLLEINKGIELSFNVKISADIARTYPAVINPHDLFEKVKGILNPEAYELMAPMMGAEDFSYYQQAVPGFFAMLGIRGLGKGEFPLHHASFDLAEESLIGGLNYFKKIVDTFAK